MKFATGEQLAHLPKDGCWVSSSGRVYVADDEGELALCPIIDRQFSVRTLAGVQTIRSLVLKAFIGPAPEGMAAWTNNGNVADNRVENLRWDNQDKAAGLVTLERVKHRLFLRGTVHAQRAAISKAKAKWDTKERAWWFAYQREADAQGLVDALNSGTAEGDDEAVAVALGRFRARIIGKTRYRGRVFLVHSATENVIRLLYLDGSNSFVAPKADVGKIIRFREPRSWESIAAYRARKAKNHPHADEE